MRILIVVPRGVPGDHASYQYLFPLGLGYIAATLKAAGHEVRALNLNHREGRVDDLVRLHFQEQGPFQMVCAGGLSTAFGRVKSIVEAVRSAAPSVRIVLGGGLVSSEPELIFQALKPDYIVVGEGEDTIRELAAVLARDGDPASVHGIGYRSPTGACLLTPPRDPIADLDALPWPDFEAFEFGTYLDHLKPSDQYFYDIFDEPRVYPIVTSRSCPFNCTFCFHPLGKKYRQRSLSGVMDELRAQVLRYRLNIVAIYDELFSSDRARVEVFCEQFARLRAEVGWDVRWGCQMRVDRLDDRLLATMKEAGCYMVSYGFESYSPAVLKSLKKYITPEQIRRALEITQRHGISIQANFIFGDRAETAATARETLDFWKQHVHAGIQLGFINPYPGTELYEHCVAKGTIRDRLDFIENHITDTLNMTDTLSPRQFAALQRDVFACQLRYPSQVIPAAVQPEASGAYALSIVCPHCRAEVCYRHYEIVRPRFFSIMFYCRRCHRRFFAVSRRYLWMNRVIRLALAVVPAFVFAGLLKALHALWRRLLGWMTRPSRPQRGA
jgi:radical SAM superfamily enzyme YgiQ (UPF0313 family)